ncbi:MAG: aspartyl protease family protein [Thermoanaerobaculia bacterium]
MVFRRNVFGRGATLGGSGSMRLAQVDSLRVGETEATDVMACVIDLSQLQSVGLEVDGLLGLNVLKNFRYGVTTQLWTDGGTAISLKCGV